MLGWQAVFIEPAKNILSQIGNFILSILGVIVILVIFWLLAKLTKEVITKLLSFLKINVLSDLVGLSDILKKGNINYTLSEIIGIICYWIVLLVGFVVAINAVGLTVAADLLNRIVLYVPNIVVAIFILILGMFISVLVSNIVYTASTNAGLNQAKVFSNIVKILIVIFAVMISLEQLQIGTRFVELIIGIFLGSLGLGLAIALGLGCKDLVGRFVSDLVEKLKRK